VTGGDKLVKRVFDLTFSIIGLFALGWLILILALFAAFDTKLKGFYRQKRIGLKGRSFSLYKIRTMVDFEGFNSLVSTDRDPRITKFGRFLRQSKLDELPQLFNILKGDMSFVGPRPDVSGFADKLTGPNLIILTVKPGLTGPATIHFKNEDQLLAQHEFPEIYNRNVIWPKKVELNLNYVQEFSFIKDVYYLVRTFV